MKQILMILSVVSIIFFALNYYIFNLGLACWILIEMITLLILLEKFLNDRL